MILVQKKYASAGGRRAVPQSDGPFLHITLKSCVCVCVRVRSFVPRGGIQRISPNFACVFPEITTRFKKDQSTPFLQKCSDFETRRGWLLYRVN